MIRRLILVVIVLALLVGVFIESGPCTIITFILLMTAIKTNQAAVIQCQNMIKHILGMEVK